jgi:hypothetical protein
MEESMKLDALSAWLKSVFHHAPPLLRADLATELWDDVPFRPAGRPRGQRRLPPMTTRIGTP